MAKLTKESFIESLKEMSLLEIKELVDAMKEEFGVDPSALAVAAPAAAGTTEDSGSSERDLVLVSAGANKVAVIKIVKEITGLGLVEAKGIADNGGVIKEKLAADEAENFKKQLEEAGAEVELK